VGSSGSARAQDSINALEMVLGASEVPLNFIRSTPYKNYDRAVRVGKIHVQQASQERGRMSFPDRTFFAEFGRFGQSCCSMFERFNCAKRFSRDDRRCKLLANNSFVIVGIKPLMAAMRV
jgi:hypothetical protein